MKAELQKEVADIYLCRRVSIPRVVPTGNPKQALHMAGFEKLD